MKLFRPLLVSFASFVLITGVAYPAVVTGLARITFPWKARGSLVQIDGQVRGSRLLAQPTEAPRYFWCRPSGARNPGCLQSRTPGGCGAEDPTSEGIGSGQCGSDSPGACDGQRQRSRSPYSPPRGPHGRLHGLPEAGDWISQGGPGLGRSTHRASLVEPPPG